MKLTSLNVKVKKTDKKIINNLNLNVKKGELLAILGPSGSGKTTFLDFITGTMNPKFEYEGEYQVGGQIKYVSQEDNLHGFYTVRQYIELYIHLNYGHSITKFRADQIVKGIAEETGLVSALDTPVGDIFKKGLSGGQKRRLSIALELVSKPDILILDEPTSGLDSYSALQIIEILKKLTSEGIIVICTLHQPSSEIWGLLDKILLLSSGYTCFTGDIKGAQQFFSYIGKNLPENYNPGDFFISQINADFNPSINPSELNMSYWKWLEAPNNRTTTENENHLEAIKVSNVREIILSLRSKANTCDKFYYLLKRSLLNLFKNPGIVVVRLVMYIMLSFMVGVMYFDLGSNVTHKDIISRTSLLFYVDAFLVFMSIAVLPFFLIERSIIEKEIRNQLYHPFHYQFSMFVMSLPAVGLIAIVSTLLVVLLANLNGFGIFFVILFLSLVTAESLARLVSLLVPHYIIGMALIAGLYGMFMLCEGFLIVKSDIPGYFIWGYYMAFHTYGFEAFMHNEFSSIEKFESLQFADGAEVLEFYDMGSVKIWRDCVIIISFALLFEVFIFVAMALKFRRRKNKLAKVLPDEKL